MYKYYIISIIVTFVCLTNIRVDAKPLLAPDTVYIDPAYYNPNLKDVGISEMIDIEINNSTGVELISMDVDLKFGVEDKTIINCVPIYYTNKNGNIVLEDKSTLKVKSIVFYDNPLEQIYETNLYINYKTKEMGFTVDTVVIVANRINKDLYTRNQSLYRDACKSTGSQSEIITFYSTLLNGSNESVTIDSIDIRSKLDYSLDGFNHQLSDNIMTNNLEIELPYKYFDKYYTLSISLIDENNELDNIFVDYYTDKGLFTDTLSIAYSEKKGIIAKSWYQTLVSLDYKTVTSKKNVIKMCSEQGYRIKSLTLEGEVDESEIELNEFYEVGDIISSEYTQLSEYSITPQKIPVQRSGKFIYELENLANGTILEVDFPFTIKVDFAASVYDNLPDGYSVYPNPANSIVNVKGRNDIQQLELVDLLGNTIISRQNTKLLDVNNVESGVYFLKIVEQNSIKLEKVIIE